MKISWIFDTGFRYDDEGRVPGWVGPMAALMIVTMTGLVFMQFRIAPGWPVTLVTAFEFLATQAFIRHRLNRVWKRGIRGALRGRASKVDPEVVTSVVSAGCINF